MPLGLRLALLAAVCCALVAAAAPVAAGTARKSGSARVTTATGAATVRFARRFVGVPYRYGGASPRSGFDCSGLVRFVFAHFGIELPHSSYAQAALGRRVVRGRLRPGDLVFFDGRGHVGLYVGRGRFLHAPRSGTRVSIDSIGRWYGWPGSTALDGSCGPRSNRHDQGFPTARSGAASDARRAPPTEAELQPRRSP